MSSPSATAIPDLQPSESDNFDVQLEWYNRKGGLYSVSVFHKEIKDFTYSKVTRFNALDANGRRSKSPAASTRTPSR